jgi:hypothetical protein
MKQRRSILQLALADDTDCLKNNLVLLNAMAEPMFKVSKVLESAVELLMMGPCPALELSQFSWFTGVGCADDSLLSMVTIVTNDSLASRDLVRDLAVIVDSVTLPFAAAKPFGAVGGGQVEPTCQVSLDTSAHLSSAH